MPAEFHQFGLLPPEIRYKIWRYTLPHRIVNLRLKPNIDVRNWVPPGDWWLHYVLDHDDDDDHNSTAGQSFSLPSALLTCYEAYQELARHYRPIPLDQPLLKRGLGGDAVWERDATPAEDYSAARLTRFCRDHDTLRWAGTARWGLSVRSPANPLFLAASLAVRRVVVEYAPAVASQLEVLALAVLDAGQTLQRLDLVATNPSDGRRLRFRLGETPSRGEVGHVTSAQSVFEIVAGGGTALFPWFDRDNYQDGRWDITEEPNPVALKAIEWQFPAASPLFENSRFHARGSYCILQVLEDSNRSSSSIGTGYSLESNDVTARVGKLMDPDKPSFQYQHARDPVRFGEDLQMDVLLWIRGLQMHAAGFPGNLPFEIVGLCCHGFCCE
ncbi:hypothetical protein PG993_002528 [Apiospora rasikravindrae]|uniref:2EXR domain-containing protein n=1 Tax=Apiospora rasikravindrae TaxID=990691 RepID=A0ABR1TX53_9PEZI